VVRDDGTGFEPGDPHAGFGLIGMHERATFAGGSLAIVSSPDGTEIRFWVPAARRPAPETAPPD
jgi:signal transduction histidine kinase